MISIRCMTMCTANAPCPNTAIPEFQVRTAAASAARNDAVRRTGQRAVAQRPRQVERAEDGQDGVHAPRGLPRGEHVHPGRSRRRTHRPHHSTTPATASMVRLSGGGGRAALSHSVGGRAVARPTHRLPVHRSGRSTNARLFSANVRPRTNEELFRVPSIRRRGREAGFTATPSRSSPAVSGADRPRVLRLDRRRSESRSFAAPEDRSAWSGGVSTRTGPVGGDQPWLVRGIRFPDPSPFVRPLHVKGDRMSRPCEFPWGRTSAVGKSRSDHCGAGVVASTIRSLVYRPHSRTSASSRSSPGDTRPRGQEAPQ